MPAEPKQSIKDRGAALNLRVGASMACFSSFPALFLILICLLYCTVLAIAHVVSLSAAWGSASASQGGGGCRTDSRLCRCNSAPRCGGKVRYQGTPLFLCLASFILLRRVALQRRQRGGHVRATASMLLLRRQRRGTSLSMKGPMTQPMTKPRHTRYRTPMCHSLMNCDLSAIFLLYYVMTDGGRTRRTPPPQQLPQVRQRRRSMMRSRLPRLLR